MSNLNTLFSGSAITKVDSRSLAPAKNASIQDQAKGFLREYSRLPTKTTRKAVIETAKIGGNLEAQNDMLKDLSKNRLNAVNQALTALQTQASYHVGILRAQNRYAQIMAGTGKQIASTRLDHAQIEANYSGYQSQFDAGMQQAEAIIDL
jgi:hypothetical protein